MVKIAPLSIVLSTCLLLCACGPRQNLSPKKPRTEKSAVSAAHNQLDKLSSSVFDREAEVGFQKLSKAEQVFLCVWSLQGDVANGGFDQYYFNSSGDTAIETVAALDTIGAKRTAALVQSMNALFGPAGPSPNYDKRHEQLERVRSSAADKMYAADSQFYKEEENLDELLAAFVAKNKGDFHEKE